MKKFQRTIIAACLGIVAFFVLMGVIGDYDYCENIILHMTQEQYDSVKNRLTYQNGYEPSERDIAHWWADHHSEYK